MSNGVGRRTETAGTPIRVLAPPSPFGFTRLSKLLYTPGATSHTATVLRAIGKTTAASVAAAGVASFSLTTDPGPAGNPLAAGDLVAVRETDGVTRLYEVQTYSGGTLTLTVSLVAGVSVGSRVWDFGVAADTDPATGEPHETYALATGGQRTLEAAAGFVGGHRADEPVLLSIDNATAAGVLDYLTWVVGSLAGTMGVPAGLGTADAGATVL